MLREAKIITGVDDHSRFCVMAAVVERATARAVCLAFAQALVKHGVPEEVLTDNGRQFTDRFSRHGPSRGEVLFDKICRRNASNENTNGLLRQYLPRTVDLRTLTQDDLNTIAAKLNGRPRQTLGFQTPSEALAEALR